MIQTEYQSGSLVQTTVSIGALFEQSTDANGAIRYQHFIRAGSQTIAIHTRTSAYTQSTTYLHRDHLGSISAMTNEDGDLEAALSFDAWGQRRNPETWQGSATNPAPNTTDRGYTGHKMLDAVNLIHMGGRVYDPAIGRFMSADPIIQAPLNAQSYNRYSYVWNNPLSAFDPSGFLRDIPGVKTLGGGMQGLMLGSGSYDSGWVDWYETIGRMVVWTLPNGQQISVPLSSLPMGMQYSIVSSGYHVNSEVAGSIIHWIATTQWTPKDQAALTASQSAYNNDSGGLLSDLGIPYAPTDGFSAYLSYASNINLYILAFSGTTFTSIADWLANGGQSLIGSASQFDQAVQLALRVHAELAGNVIFTGHSLGGALAAAASYATGADAITFNAEGLHSSYRTGSPGNIRAHYTRADILTNLQWLTPLPNAAGAQIPHSADGWFCGPICSHSLSNFP